MDESTSATCCWASLELQPSVFARPSLRNGCLASLSSVLSKYFRNTGSLHLNFSFSFGLLKLRHKCCGLAGNQRQKRSSLSPCLITTSLPKDFIWMDPTHAKDTCQSEASGKNRTQVPVVVGLAGVTATHRSCCPSNVEVLLTFHGKA